MSTIVLRSGVEDIIDDYFLNLLPAGAVEVFEAHLLICDGCRAAFHKHEQILERFRPDLYIEAPSNVTGADR